MWRDLTGYIHAYLHRYIARLKTTYAPLSIFTDFNAASFALPEPFASGLNYFQCLFSLSSKTTQSIRKTQSHCGQLLINPSLLSTHVLLPASTLLKSHSAKNLNTIREARLISWPVFVRHQSFRNYNVYIHTNSIIQTLQSWIISSLFYYDSIHIRNVTRH